MISDVGARMLVLRKLNGWSQRQLAKRAGVPHSAISMIEHGQVSPSINSLQKVLDGVPISLAEFFALDLNVQIRVFFKNKALRAEGSEGIQAWQLKTKGDQQGPVLERKIYAPGSDTGEELLTNEGEMAGFIVDGELEVTIGGETETLVTGDGFYFECRRPFRFRNLSNKPCEVLNTLIPDQNWLLPRVLNAYVCLVLN